MGLLLCWRHISEGQRMAKRNGREATAAAIRSVPKIRRASSRREARRCRRWEVVILGEGVRGSSVENSRDDRRLFLRSNQERFRHRCKETTRPRLRLGLRSDSIARTASLVMVMVPLSRFATVTRFTPSMAATSACVPMRSRAALYAQAANSR